MASESLEFRYALRSDRGLIRSDNQDAGYADAQVLALADGMGGPPAGDVAGSLMIEPFSRIRPRTRVSDVVDPLRRAAFRGDHAIAAHVEANPGLDGMGTTLTAVLLDGDALGLLHVGDSRAYLLRDSVLYQLSHDDTLVQALVDRGTLSADEASVHPQRNVLLRAMQGRQTRFSLANFTLKAGDRLVLCSDGVSDVLTDETLARACADPNLDRCAESVVALALSHGSRDNVTCIVAEVVLAEREGRF